MTMDDLSSVYVGGLAFDCTEDLLRKSFEAYGEILAVKLVVNHNGQPRGFGFVTFTHPEAASDAIQRMNGTRIGGRTIKVNDVKNRAASKLVLDNSFRENERGNERGNDRERDRGHRDRNGHGRHLSPIGWKSPTRSSRAHRRSRSPRSGRSRSPRSRSPLSRDSFKREEDDLRKKTSKGKNADAAKLKDELAKVMQSHEDRKAEVLHLEQNLDRAYMTISDMKAEEQRMEDALSTAVAEASRRASQLKKMQRAYLEVQRCKEQLRHSEEELAGVMASSGLEIESNDYGGHDGRYDSLPNGDQRISEDVQ